MQEIKKWLNHTFSVHSGRRLQLSCLSWLSWLSVTSLSCEVAQITSQMAEKAKSSERCRVFFQRTKAQRILSMSRNLVTDTITYLLLGASKGRGWTREESENSWNFWMLEDGMEIIELFLLIQNSFMIWSVLVNIMWWLLVLVDGSWKKLANESRFAAVTNVLDGVCYWPENYQKQSLNGLGCKKRHHTPFQPLQFTFFWWEIYIDKVYTIDHYSDQCLIHDQLQQYGPNWPRDDWSFHGMSFEAWTQRPERYGCFLAPDRSGGLKWYQIFVDVLFSEVVTWKWLVRLYDALTRVVRSL